MACRWLHGFGCGLEFDFILTVESTLAEGCFLLCNRKFCLVAMEADKQGSGHREGLEEW